MISAFLANSAHAQMTLGVRVDNAPGNRGAKVISVKEPSIAEMMRLEAGDVITGVQSDKNNFVWLIQTSYHLEYAMKRTRNKATIWFRKGGKGKPWRATFEGSGGGKDIRDTDLKVTLPEEVEDSDVSSRNSKLPPPEES
jgi:hypothetical protein